MLLEIWRKDANAPRWWRWCWRRPTAALLRVLLLLLLLLLL
jgi:hypothetical protein